jgi:very-short-patch-repair endonuclease
LFIQHIVDFLIEPNIVEVEGPVHYRKDVTEKDHRKVNYLESQGYDVYRFYYRDILKDPERIAKMIYNKWKENHYEFKEISNFSRLLNSK